jgi:hypothetical protein
MFNKLLYRNLLAAPLLPGCIFFRIDSFKEAFSMAEGLNRSAIIHAMGPQKLFIINGCSVV